MKYIEQELHIELHPEDQSDRDYIRKEYAGHDDFDFWCVAKKYNELSQDCVNRLFNKCKTPIQIKEVPHETPE